MRASDEPKLEKRPRLGDQQLAAGKKWTREQRKAAAERLSVGVETRILPAKEMERRMRGASPAPTDAEKLDLHRARAYALRLKAKQN